MLRFRKRWTAAIAVAIAFSLSAPAHGDARSDYLINMLENGATYRTKVQAATTLGVIRSAEAVPALIRALVDESEFVIISASNALGQIGDPSAIPALEDALKVAPSAPTQTQLATTLRVLRALQTGGDLEPATAATPRYLIRVDAMGNSSTSLREGLTDDMKSMVIERLGRQPGVMLQTTEMSGAQAKAVIKKEKLKAFILSGSIIRLERADMQMVVKISLNVFSNPGYNLLAMPSAEGAVSVSEGQMTADAEKSAQDRALKAVIDALVGSVLRSLEGMESR